jgi:hypothetical protein
MSSKTERYAKQGQLSAYLLIAWNKFIRARPEIIA